jgi:fatty-acyl-CoA synthase
MADDLTARLLMGAAKAEDLLDIVDCGEVLPSYEFAIRDAGGNDLPDRQCGRVCLKGPSVMRGYFQDPAPPPRCSHDGWLDTGDIGYRVGRRLFITARSKDVIIINGRNIWPQDLEHLADDLPGVRQGNVSAFAAPVAGRRGPGGAGGGVPRAGRRKRRALIDQLETAVHTHFGVHAYIDLVPPGTLPRTSSGKLARSRTKQDFLARVALVGNGWHARAANG